MMDIQDKTLSVRPNTPVRIVVVDTNGKTYRVVEKQEEDQIFNNGYFEDNLTEEEMADVDSMCPPLMSVLIGKRLTLTVEAEDVAEK